MTTQYANYTNDELKELLNDIRDFENTKILKDSKFRELVDISMENSGNSQLLLTAMSISNNVYKEASNRWIDKNEVIVQEEFDKFSKELLSDSFNEVVIDVELVRLANKYNLVFSSEDGSIGSEAYEQINKDD